MNNKLTKINLISPPSAHTHTRTHTDGVTCLFVCFSERTNFSHINCFITFKGSAEIVRKSGRNYQRKPVKYFRIRIFNDPSIEHHGAEFNQHKNSVVKMFLNNRYAFIKCTTNFPSQNYLPKNTNITRISDQ